MVKYVVAGAAILGSLATTHVAGAITHNFNLDPTGSQGFDWEKTVGAATVHYYGLNGGSLDVVAATAPSAPYTTSNSLKLVGSGDDYHKIVFDTGSGYPTLVIIDVMAYAGDIDVEAYDSSDTLLDRQVAEAGTSTQVEFDEAEIDC